jgi:hypothetical protein
MATPGEVAWTTPGAWSTVPNPNSMRKATYKVPRTTGDTEDAELAVSQAGGDLDANITRWEGQFEGGPKAKKTDVTVDGLKVIVVEIEGAFLGAGMGGPAGGKKTGFKMLAAIAPGASASTFFKLVGPLKTVNAARVDFDGMVKSFKLSK